MIDVNVHDELERTVTQADALAAGGEGRQAIDLLTSTNRRMRHADLERALVRLRREAGSPQVGKVPLAWEQIATDGSDRGVFEVAAADLDVAAVRAGIAQSGCVLVRGLVPPDQVAQLVEGIDRAIAAYDAVTDDHAEVDPCWYDPLRMPDRAKSGLPDWFRRQVMRKDGGLWTADSPRMLFELFEVVDQVGMGRLMSEFLGERPLLSAQKCTLRRVPPVEVVGGWHQDGAFLGDEIGSFNFWLSLSDCGVDAPGLDLVPRRIDEILPSDEEAQFDWSLSDRTVLAAAGEMPIARPRFGPGDALLFDHRLVHRTAASPGMTRDRYAIEAWFFAPSAFPKGQLPLLY